MKNVHSEGGDFLVVLPSAHGWCLCWYVPDDEEETFRDPFGPTSDPEQQDDESRITDEWCTKAGVKVVQEDCDDEDSDLVYVWETRSAAQDAADAIMRRVHRHRSAPWAEAAKAAGWTPPPGWDDDSSSYRSSSKG